MARTPEFQLTKWSLDCVSDQGDVFIGHAAELRWMGKVVDYASAMRQAEGGGTETKHSVRREARPDEQPDVVTWRCDALGVTGTWRRLVPPIERVIYETKEGAVIWRCVMPHANAEVITPGWPPLTGRGYVEKLTVTIPVSKLPIDSLRWGRFHSAGDDVVWIDWQGPVNARLVYLSGELVERARVSDDDVAIAAPPVTISLDRRRVLRDARLVDGALQPVPGVKELIAARTHNARETRWLSAATFREGEKVQKGWALHGLLRW